MLGFREAALPLDQKALRDLGLQEAIDSARVTDGEGALRALILATSATISTRELVQRAAASLSARVPHLLWVLFTFNEAAGEIAIACWQPGKRHPRVVALTVSSMRVLESDADTLCALAAARSTSDILTHVRWNELLGREAITRRFFQSLKVVVELVSDDLPPRIAVADRREISILTISRLLFLSFLETRGWLNGDFDFLANQFAACMARGGRYHRRVLDPLFFGTLNTKVGDRAQRAREFGRVPFLNGGLFSRSPLEKKARSAVISDETLSEIFSRLLTSFRFSAREDSASWSETAIDPEILGKAFEALMAASERKTTGAFYTPQRLVEHVTESAMIATLSPLVDREVLRALLATGTIPEPSTRKILLARICDIRLLDPTCGSGAFLVHALEKLTELRLRLGEIGTVSVIRRRVLASSIFGIDINPMAVWLCQLRLWLAIVIDSTDPDPMHVTPLPNLDRQIRIGDSLLGGSFTADRAQPRGQKLALLRGRYTRAIGSRKKTLSRQLDREERREGIRDLERVRARIQYQRREIIRGSRAPDLFGVRSAPDGATLARLRALKKSAQAAAARQRRLESGGALPFAFNVHFADVAERGGFDVIVGNPPWVRIHNIGPASRQTLASQFKSFSRAAWQNGAALAGSGHAFANQIDLASLFVERSVFLLREGGAISLLVPAKLFRSLSGGGIREIMHKHLRLVALEDMTESRSGFDAAVYPSLIVGQRSSSDETHNEIPLAAAVHRSGSVLQWEMPPRSLPLDRSSGSPWILAPAEVRHSFEKLSAAGPSLAASHFGRPILGVKTGCNSAFVVPDADTCPGVEPSLLRPVVRGETLTPWRFEETGERIIWTHTADRAPLKRLPDGARHWLSSWRATLERRSDGRASSCWWSLFRTEGAILGGWRVVWCDFGKAPRAFALPADSPVVPLNTCYVARCANRDDALALAVLLNGPLLASWLDTIAEPARGGYRRYLGWTVALMPIPRDWPRAAGILAPIGEDALRGNIPSRTDLLKAALQAYRVKRSEMEALISWTTRS
jgi:hypothetical protein